LDAVLTRIPVPSGNPEGPFQMQVTTFDSTEHLGRIAIGRVARGRLEPGTDVLVWGGMASPNDRECSDFLV
jgi:GTP-binding protein